MRQLHPPLCGPSNPWSSSYFERKFRLLGRQLRKGKWVYNPFEQKAAEKEELGPSLARESWSLTLTKTSWGLSHVRTLSLSLSLSFAHSHILHTHSLSQRAPVYLCGEDVYNCLRYICTLQAICVPVGVEGSIAFNFRESGSRGKEEEDLASCRGSS
ncbi:MAG: hypothetical protein J3Q66DRAFT_144447 [Benniella sp.]|nr:MAG: hypothetical protein J3Q66DRAFT_144447 [Benniella sp.]